MKTSSLNELQSNIPEKYDVFICSASFEKRCLSVCLSIKNIKFSKSFIIFNKEYEIYSKDNISKQKKILGQHCSLVQSSLQNPLFTADMIKENIVGYIQTKRIKKILLDITTFSHESLLILLKLLTEYCSNCKITCLYTNAKDYCFGDNVDEKWLSKGIEEIRSVLGYPGNLMPSRKTHLIVIVGYEYERAISMINMLEPNVLSLGYGKSENATVEKDREANSHYLKLVMEMSPSYPNINKFEISCNDPYETYKNLRKQIRRFKNENILISPMNNKISTIGVGLLALQYEEIQICYGPAITYNLLNYSIPGDLCYIFDIEK
ncbi:MAG: hypothetical protein LBE13_15605 [Bacteroidales bacterium]|jgi:hypothetical protein|nr:hypothetical protein [Bacteroidales bacterium]